MHAWLQQGNPIEERYKESMDRGPIVNQLVYCINSYREAALSKDPKFDHIDVNDKQKVFALFLVLFCIKWFIESSCLVIRSDHLAV